MENSEISYSRAFKQITKSAGSSLPLAKILNSVAKSVTKALKATGCSIMLLSPQRRHLDIVAAYGLSDVYLKKGVLDANRSLYEVMQGKTIAVFNAKEDKRTQYPEVADAEKISSILATPVFQGGEVIGQIRVYSREPRRYSHTEKDFVSTVASIVSIVLERTELRQMLEDRHSENVSKSQTLTEIPKLPPSSLRPSTFGHPSEEEFAKLLDFYRIEWLYEPRSFPLQWQGDRVTEMFTPDFYLPELDLYIELTTLKQSLITEKNRKVRRLRELYPDINIKLLTKNDYLKLLAKYGYGSLAATKVRGIDRVLFSHTQIQRRVKALAKQISKDYAGKKLVLVGVLKGVICFMSDIMQYISIPLDIDFMAISYYGSNGETRVKITKDLDINIAGLDVLMVEDIVDTGMTLNYVLAHLASQQPSSLRVCTLLDKRVRRLVNVPLHYVGFEVPDEFVVGYGLDFHGEYRNLPFIGVLSPEFIEESQK